MTGPTNTYNKLSYITSRVDPCVRYKREDNSYTLTDTYTDDIFGASSTEEKESPARLNTGNDKVQSTAVLGAHH